jgi:hypothetical protein
VPLQHQLLRDGAAVSLSIDYAHADLLAAMLERLTRDGRTKGGKVTAVEISAALGIVSGVLRRHVAIAGTNEAGELTFAITQAGVDALAAERARLKS